MTLFTQSLAKSEQKNTILCLVLKKSWSQQKFSIIWSWCLMHNRGILDFLIKVWGYSKTQTEGAVNFVSLYSI